MGPQAWQQVPLTLSHLSILLGVFYHSNRKGRKRTGEGEKETGGKEKMPRTVLILQLRAKMPQLGLTGTMQITKELQTLDHL